MTRTVYLESLAIFARYADYIYIESIIPPVQSTTCFICHFCTAAPLRAPPLVLAAYHLFHYFLTLPEQYCQFNDYCERNATHIIIYVYSAIIYSTVPPPRLAAKQIPQSGPRRRRYKGCIRSICALSQSPRVAIIVAACAITRRENAYRWGWVVVSFIPGNRSSKINWRALMDLSSF